MSKQTVFRLPIRTSYNNLTSFEEDVPTITKHEVLIRIRAVALNSRDVQVAKGKYPFPASDSLIPCSDGAGDIVAVGESVQDFKEGDRVVINFDLANLYGTQQGWLSCQGGYIDGVLAQYVARPASSVVKVPASARQSYSELASLVCAGVTAWNGLFGNFPLKPGQTVLVQGLYQSVLDIFLENADKCSFLRHRWSFIYGPGHCKSSGRNHNYYSSSNEKLELVKAKFQPDYCINYKEYPD